MNSQQPHENRCIRTFSDGRRCRMLLSPGHPSLCPFHAREEQQRLESEKLARELSQELASLSGNLNTGLDINHVLGKVFKALAQRKISTREANAFAYLAQLMLHSMRYVKNEIFWATQDADAYHRMVRQSIPVHELTNPQPKTPPSPTQQPRPTPPTQNQSLSAVKPAPATTGHVPASHAATGTDEPPSPVESPSVPPVLCQGTALAVPKSSEISPPLGAEGHVPPTMTLPSAAHRSETGADLAREAEGHADALPKRLPPDPDSVTNSSRFRSYAKPARKFHRMNRSIFDVS